LEEGCFLSIRQKFTRLDVTVDDRYRVDVVHAVEQGVHNGGRLIVGEFLSVVPSFADELF